MIVGVLVIVTKNSGGGSRVCLHWWGREGGRTDRHKHIYIYTRNCIVSGFLFSVIICKLRSDDDGFLVLDSFCVQVLNKSFETWVSKEFFSRILFPFINFVTALVRIL